MKIKINKGLDGIGKYPPQLEVFTDSGHEISRISSLNISCLPGEFPVANMTVLGLSDQEFEILDQNCGFIIETEDLSEIPTKLLEEEIERRK